MDTGTMRNTIVYMAAELIKAKANENRVVAELFREKDKKHDTQAILKSDAQEMDAAVALMERLAGCWS